MVTTSATFRDIVIVGSYRFKMPPRIEFTIDSSAIFVKCSNFGKLVAPCIVVRTKSNLKYYRYEICHVQ